MKLSLSYGELNSLEPLEIAALAKAGDLTEDTIQRAAHWPAAGFVDTEIRCFNGTGEWRCREGSSTASLSLRPFVL